MYQRRLGSKCGLSVHIFCGRVSLYSSALVIENISMIIRLFIDAVLCKVQSNLVGSKFGSLLFVILKEGSVYNFYDDLTLVMLTLRRYSACSWGNFRL